MQLTEEMVELAKGHSEICTIYNEEYVLLKKQMPVDDAHLAEYIRLMEKAQERGINLARVVDFRLLDERCDTYGGRKFSQGVYLEERAPGECINDEAIWLKPDKDYDYEEVANRYLHNVTSYITELEKRAKASDEVYDKLVKDYLGLESVGLEADPKPSNFFFSESKGYTIIDPIPLARKGKMKEAIVGEIWLVILGFGLKSLMVGYSNYHFLPDDLNAKLVSYGNAIAAKVKKSLVKNGVDEALVDQEIAKNQWRYIVDNQPTEVADLGIRIASTLQEVAKVEQKQVSHSCFFD